MNKLGGILLILGMLFSIPVLAATTANSIITPQTPNRAIVQFLQGTDVAGTYKTLYTSNANGSMIKGIWETNNDGSATHLVTCQIVNGGVKYGGVAFTTVSNSGFANNTPAINLLDQSVWPGLPVDSDGNPYILLISGDTLQCTFATALTATDVINLTAVVTDF